MTPQPPPPAPPPPPWHCSVEAVVWAHRAGPGSRESLPPPLRAGPGVAVTAAAMITYADSPVGPYREVVASPRLLRGLSVRGSVPFIAVDSVASQEAGRRLWALPKSMAAFEDGTASGDGWTITVSARRLALALPIAVPFAFRQLGADGALLEARGRFAGRGAAALVTVAGRGLPQWLRTGRHVGAVLRGRLDLGAAVRTGEAGALSPRAPGVAVPPRPRR